jgi:hypothetical protein
MNGKPVYLFLRPLALARDGIFFGFGFGAGRFLAAGFEGFARALMTAFGLAGLTGGVRVDAGSAAGIVGRTGVAGAAGLVVEMLVLATACARPGEPASADMRTRSNPSFVGRYVHTSEAFTWFASHNRRAASYMGTGT